MTPGQVQQFILGEFGGGASLVTVRNQLAQQAFGTINGESLNWAAQKISDVLPNAFPNQGWDFSGLFTDPNITTGIPQGPAPRLAPLAVTPPPSQTLQGPTDVSALPPLPMPPDWEAGGGQPFSATGSQFVSQPEWSPGVGWQAIAAEARRALAAQRADDQTMQQVYNSSAFGQGQPNVSNQFGAPQNAPNWFGTPTPVATNWFGTPTPAATNWFGQAPQSSASGFTNWFN